MVTVRVPLLEQRDASYDILIGPGLVRQLDTILPRYCPAAAYAIISDAHVGAAYGEPLNAALQGAGLNAHLFTFPTGEWNKTRDTWASLSDQMLAAHLGRDCAVIALGGGVVNDVGGFVAATYLRGVNLVQVPTSLLAMIDSSIGGKTGVDVPAGKNLLGAFHQPRVVVADPELLGSLTSAQLATGLAEALKHGVVADADYFAFLEREYAAIFAKHAPALERLVRRSVEIKARVVAEDEREKGKRAILNFGHTIGHAIETTSHYEVLHGEAVAIGMVYEARLAETIGIAAPGVAQRIATALERLNLPVERPDASQVDDLIEAMRSDKKVRDGKIRLALPRAIGRAHGDDKLGWTVAVDESALRQVLVNT
ncbi:MAG: 3-dehydroquinate synthase [Gemmatimonadales bacterium]